MGIASKAVPKPSCPRPHEIDITRIRHLSYSVYFPFEVKEPYDIDDDFRLRGQYSVFCVRRAT